MPVFAIGEKPSDFTGDSFYASPVIGDNGEFMSFDDYETQESNKQNNPNKTTNNK